MIFLMLLVGGCTLPPSASVTPPATDALIWSHNITGAEALWRKEAEFRTNGVGRIEDFVN